MEPQYEDSLGVAEAIRGMTDEEVRSLMDETYASGFVQTLQDVTTVLAKVEEQAAAQAQQLPMFA
jgi:hypothetical protein